MTIHEARNGISQGRIIITSPAVQNCVTENFSSVVSKCRGMIVWVGERAGMAVAAASPLLPQYMTQVGFQAPGPFGSAFSTGMPVTKKWESGK